MPRDIVQETFEFEAVDLARAIENDADGEASQRLFDRRQATSFAVEVSGSHRSRIRQPDQKAYAAPDCFLSVVKHPKEGGVFLPFEPEEISGVANLQANRAVVSPIQESDAVRDGIE